MYKRQGIIIGKGGQEVDKLKEELKKITDKDIPVSYTHLIVGSKEEYDRILANRKNVLDYSEVE